MKTILKKLFVFVAIIISVFATTSTISSPATFAANPNADPLGSCRSFFGMTSWDCGINNQVTSQDILTSNIFIIASNIFTDITVLATYLVLGFVIYGGYLYIFSGGDVGKVANAKKTLTHAFIGLAIVLLSNVILNSIRIAFLGNNGSFASDCATAGTCVSETAFISNTLNWFIGTSGVVAFAYVVMGGIGYLTSAGDSAKLQKAKSTIIYAIIGLIIVALALSIKEFFISVANDASTASLPNNIITKEIAYEN